MFAMDLMHTLACAMRPFAARAALLAACALLAASPAQAQWKWISSAGVVQYSDQPPPSNIPAKNILAKPLAAATAPYAPSASAAASSAAAPPAKEQAQTQAAHDLQQKLEQDKRAKEAAQNLQKQIEAQARQANCLQAQRQLQTLDSGVRMAEVDPQGNRTYMTDAQRAAQRQQAAAAIAANCR
ncbi:hypothetical protein GALL_242700 [mine drainage metagenome]|uniref:DUF4124 domain-containing protein n=1 Tax=mine drainage metagenome TaxID=410659 RepID=A0A1J5RCG7_9ZZZZ